MTDSPDRPPRDSTGRDRRLRDALRENLKRRKAQARGRADQAAPEAQIDSPSASAAVARSDASG